MRAAAGAPGTEIIVTDPPVKTRRFPPSWPRRHRLGARWIASVSPPGRRVRAAAGLTLERPPGSAAERCPWLEAVPAAAPHAATLADHYRRLEAYERQGIAGDEEWRESPPELDCEALRPPSARTCGEVQAGLRLLDAALRELGDGERPAEEQYQKLASGLEHLFLAGVPPASIDAGYRALVTRLPPVGDPTAAAPTSGPE